MALPQSMTLFLSSFISPNAVKVIPKNHFFNFTLSSKFDIQYKAVRVPTRVQALKSSDGADRYDSDSDSDSDDDDRPQGMENDPYSMSLEERKEWRQKIRQMMVKQVMDKKHDIREVELGDGDVRYISDSDSDDDDDDDDSPRVKENDPDSMSLEERQEWRKNIRQVMEKKPDIEEDSDPVEKKNKMQKLLADYPLVVEEDDPDWPEDADGWGFSFGQFFDKITIKNNKKENDDDDDDDENEIVWQDDNYIRPIKDIKSSEWEETVFKDISPLIILAHNRYKRPKENERIRNDLEKAVHIIWNCGLPSPRCVALDAVIETELVAALRVSVFPEVLFTKAGKILFRDKETRSADEFSKIMAFFYFGAAKPPCLNNIKYCQEDIPSFNIDNPVS